ncbi:hypothetical protein DOTSEDRAFT_84788 [Dothistroma septosporum NZE10]|uniref:Coiled-coil domain-containing protein 16 n=1 Tax=Dothistroma septosporum (strain NZE10 / CBS 128990) TaxID=675120 RepID=N1Q131_DOTSN|nr:hypothetical protein DOTSEDRAFT_84788 [Dothistroma septosporum NZE10]
MGPEASYSQKSLRSMHLSHMLRASREARKIKHPHASYTKDGKLLCNLCEVTIKADSAWQGHLHSTQHTLRLNRAQDAAAARSVSEETGMGASKKRKASTIDSLSPEDRKKSKPVTFTPGVEEMDYKEAGPVQTVTQDPQTQAQEGTIVPQKDEQGADPAELEAFERELAEMERSMRNGATTHQGVVVSAAPVSAEEIAAQAREQQSTQRGRRDAESAAEKEDATRLLEDEFEEMEGLEERARKLREKREALRTATAPNSQAVKATDATVGSKNSPSSASLVGDVNGDEAEEDDEDDDYDEWNFGNS